MAFGTVALINAAAVGAGERVGSLNTILPAITFEDGLKVGRFAKLDTGSIDNMDGSGTPVIAGVVLRTVGNAIESDGTYDADTTTKIEYIRQGFVTVDVKAGETPSLFDRVYVSNAGNASDGLATATNTDVAVNAEFIQEVQSGVWLIYVNPAPGDIATHLGDALAAHAASAISLLDTAGLTAQTEVEAVIAEILPHVPVLIADPGDAGAIPVTRSGNCAITTAASETRTLAIPAAAGIVLDLSCDVYAVGDAVITVASAFNQAGNTTITLDTAGDFVRLAATQVAGALVWRLVVNDGATLG
jgi:hypothetical protein